MKCKRSTHVWTTSSLMRRADLAPIHLPTLKSRESTAYTKIPGIKDILCVYLFLFLSPCTSVFVFVCDCVNISSTIDIVYMCVRICVYVRKYLSLFISLCTCVFVFVCACINLSRTRRYRVHVVFVFVCACCVRICVSQAAGGFSRSAA